MSVDMQVVDRMEEFLNEEMDAGAEYVTVRSVSKALKIKQTDVMDNLPAGFRMEPAASGTLAESRVVRSDGDEVQEDDLDNTFGTQYPDETDFEVGEEEELGQDYDVESNEEDEDEDDESPELSPKTAKVKKEKTEEEDNRVICLICGSPIRSSTEDQRGVCPRCWAELVRNSEKTGKALLELSDEDFSAAITAERERRVFLEDYKASRILTKEEFETMKDTLIPVKDLFAAAREQKIGPGRVAQMVGGDKFRHEPFGGFGSIWTPFFFGARKAWYFDKEVLNHLDEIKRIPKPKKEKVAGTGNGNGRKGTRGKEMKVVAPEPEKVQSGQIG